MIEATELDVQQVQGRLCRHLAVTVDLGRASAATPDGVATPHSDRFEDLLALPAEVWIDESHVRRVRHDTRRTTTTVQFREFGTQLDQLDWTRLPTFGSFADIARTKTAEPKHQPPAHW